MLDEFDLSLIEMFNTIVDFTSVEPVLISGTETFLRFYFTTFREENSVYG